VVSTDRELTVANFSDTVRYEVTMLDESNTIPCGSKDTITVIFHPAPQVDITHDGISASEYAFCVSDGAQTLSAWHPTHTPAGRMQYKWYRNSNYSTIIGTGETLTVPNTYATALYTVVVIDGIDTTFCQTADSVTVRFNPNPVADIRIGTSSAPDVVYYCNSAGAKPLSGSHTTHGAGITYEWYNANDPDNLILVGSSAVFNAANFSDSVKYLLVVTNTSQPTNCKSYDSVKVVFTADPTVEILYNGVSTDNASYCLSDGLQVLTAVPSIPTVTYQWFKVGTGAIAGATGANLTVSTSGVYRVEVTDVSRPSNCKGSDEITVNVIANPPTSLPDSTIVCTNMGTLTVLASGLSYTWTGPGGFTASTQSINVFPGEEGWYYVTITDPITLCQSVDSSYVMFSQPAAAAITYDNSVPLCENAPITLSAFDPEHINDGGVTYLWSTGANTPTITVSGTGTVTYSVTIRRNLGGCTSTASVTLSFNPAPVIPIPDVALVCAPSDTLGTSLPPGYTYTWTGPGITGTYIGQLLSVSDTGVYTLTALDVATGCIKSKQIRVLQQNPPVSGLTDTIFVCERNLPVSINARDLSHGSHINYTWYHYTDLTTPVATGAVLTTSVGGSYVVRIGNTHSSCFIYDTVAVVIKVNPIVEIVGYDGPHCSRGDTLFAQVTNLTDMMIRWYGPGIDGPNNGLSIKVTASGVYTLVVTDMSSPAQCSTTKSIAVLVNEKPRVEINKTAPYVICQGDVKVLDAYHPTHLPSFTYQWKDLRTNAVLSDSAKLYLSTALYTAPIYEEFRIELLVKNPAVNCEKRDTIRVQFKQRTNVKILPPEKLEICLGESLLLTADGATGYTWSTGEKDRVIIWKPVTTGYHTITVEGTYSNGCDPTKASILLKVNPLPVVYLPDTLQTCETDTIFLDAFDFSHPFATLYSWKNLEDGSILSVNPFFKVASSSLANLTYDPVRVELTVTDSLTGCYSRDTTVIKFNRAPAVSIQVNDDDRKICLGDSVLLVARGGTIYKWNTGAETDSLWVKPDRIGFAAYRVTVSYPNVCRPVEDSITLTVFRAPRVKAHTRDTVNICQGEEITLLPSGALTYTWEHDPTLSGSIKVRPMVSTTYYVWGTNENGCSARDSVRIEITPTINPAPNVIFCKGETAVIGEESTVPATYLWEPGGERTPKITVKEEGIYTVTVNVENCTYKRSIFVQFLATPQIYLVKDTTLCFEDPENNFEHKSHLILPKILNRKDAATYITVWRNDEEEIISTSDTLWVAKPGKYNLKVMALFGNTVCGENVNLNLNIKELCPPRIFIPEAFTPNGDGLNERFKVFGNHVYNFKMTIYNRWNEVVHTLEAGNLQDIPEEAWWDGTMRGEPAPDGQYAWTITYSTDADVEREKLKLQGAFILVR
jgi:gliding motility-associated-like protein